ncbi:pilus assembly protein PilP [Betaproteobacteria bacterium]|nr:pilus assembly protein PilP [Betaproteobacteria bacterium]GHU44149.1 pilus assembly protein PilP [Betaproteobacteria bacterium]
MIRINLLPYKEEIRKAKRKQFYSMAVMFAILGAVIVGLVYTTVELAISNQRSTNKALQDAIDAAKDQVEEIAKIKAQTQALLGRKNAIESLQTDRANTVHLLSELVQQTPEGIYLIEVKQTGRAVMVKGYTQSNSRVSNFMRNIESSNWMAASQLIEVRASVVNGRRIPEFSLNFQLVPDKSEAAARAAAAAATAEGGEES